MNLRAYGIAVFGVLTLTACIGEDNASGTNGSVNSVVATASTSGTVEVGVGGTGRNVAITFTTNDGLAASAFAVTNLASLPAGWTAPSAIFNCETVSTGNGCRLNLRYAPNSGTSGTVTINYGYVDHAGKPRTGSIGIPYLATYGNNVVAATMPSGQVSAVVGGSAASVLVTFTTNDGKPASSLTLTTALTALPSGWSSANASFSCSSVSTGNSCQLPLAFAPTSAGSGTLQLDYNYADSAGSARSGSVDISYTATSGSAHLYVADGISGNVVSCAIGGGAPSGCVAIGSGFSQPTSIALYTDGGSGNTYAYVSDSSFNAVIACDVDSSGSFSSCANSGVGTGSGAFNYPGYLTVAGTSLYVADSNDFSGPVLCTIGSGGALSGCGQTNAVTSSNQVIAIAVSGSHAYISTPGDYGLPNLLVCTVGNAGTLSACADSGTGLTPGRMFVSGNFLYAIGIAVDRCTIATDGSLGSCTAFSPTVGSSTPSIASAAIHNGVAYVAYSSFNMSTSTFVSGVAYCPVAVDGSFVNCTDSGASFTNATDVAVH